MNKKEIKNNIEGNNIKEDLKSNFDKCDTCEEYIDSYYNNWIEYRAVSKNRNIKTKFREVYCNIKCFEDNGNDIHNLPDSNNIKYIIARVNLDSETSPDNLNIKKEKK